MEMTGKPLIVFRDIGKEYISSANNSVVTALQQINFSVVSGEFLVILGPSGSGKTTLLNMIAGFEQPTSGSLTISGVPIEGPSWERVVVFQEHGLFPWLTVADNIEFGLKMKGVPAAERRRIVSNYIRIVGLEGFGDKYPKELSGGMKQRVGIARALAVDSEVVVMDEPLGALDAQTRTEMHDELLRILQHEKKKTVILVTHSIDEALKLGDRILVLSARPGRIREILEINKRHPRDVLTDPDIIALNVELHRLLFEESAKHAAYDDPIQEELSSALL